MVVITWGYPLPANCSRQAMCLNEIEATFCFPSSPAYFSWHTNDIGSCFHYLGHVCKLPLFTFHYIYNGFSAFLWGPRFQLKIIRGKDKHSSTLWNFLTIWLPPCHLLFDFTMSAHLYGHPTMSILDKINKFMVHKIQQNSILFYERGFL